MSIYDRLRALENRLDDVRHAIATKRCDGTLIQKAEDIRADLKFAEACALDSPTNWRVGYYLGLADREMTEIENALMGSD